MEKTLVLANQIIEVSKGKEKVVLMEKEYFVPYKTDQVTRDDYIISCWNRKFPDQKLEDIKRIQEFITSSEALQEWYSMIMANYQINVNMPDYLKDLIPVEDFNKVKIKFDRYKQRQSLKSESINKVALRMQNEIEKISKEFEKDEEELKKDPLLYILTLNRSHLPLDLQSEIINFTPKDAEDPVTKKQFSKEKVINFQKDLIKAWKERGCDPSVYVSKVRGTFRISSFIE